MVESVANRSATAVGPVPPKSSARRRHPGPRSAEDRQVDTRDRIIAAALIAFAGRGFEATSLDAIARTVGVRKQTLLYWFSSKQNLLFAVIDRVVEDLGSRLFAATQRCPPERRLVAVVDATFRIGAAEPQLLAVVREVARLGPPAASRLVAAAEPLLVSAALALTEADPTDGDRADALLPEGEDVSADEVRALMLAAGARVVGIVTEAELRADLALPVDLAWLRSRRRDLLDFIAQGLPTSRCGSTLRA